MKRFLISSLFFIHLLVAYPGISIAQVSEQQAANIAVKHRPGRVLAIAPESQNDTTIYRVKILDNKGGIHIIVVDGKTGSVLSAH